MDKYEKDIPEAADMLKKQGGHSGCLRSSEEILETLPDDEYAGKTE
ncbi:hypothetical protein MASR2M17_01130 [Aminivibrio sp.]